MILEKTVFVNPKDIQRNWHIIDAKDLVLGKVAVAAAHLLRGKHKVEFTPHQEIGDYVIIVNARYVKLTGQKHEQKIYYRHSGYPGSLREEKFKDVVVRKPCFPVEQAIRLMLPKNSLGRKLFTNVKVFADAQHTHAAQKPMPFEVK